METIFFTVLLLMAIFLILLVLVQRGRGGGLAGALGGPGGSSAFGAKAGDTFTKITIWAASIWIVTCIAASYWATNHLGDALGPDDANTVSATIDLDGAGDAADDQDGVDLDQPLDNPSADGSPAIEGPMPGDDEPADTEEE